MAINIKNYDVEQLASEVAKLAGESKTEAIRKSLAARKEQLLLSGKAGASRTKLKEILETRFWPKIPQKLLGKAVSKEEEAEILGYD